MKVPLRWLRDYVDLPGSAAQLVELVHRIQGMRKNAGFEISDRIIIFHSESELLRRIFATHDAYIREETLADDIIEGPPPGDAYSEEQAIDGEKVMLGVRRVP